MIVTPLLLKRDIDLYMSIERIFSLIFFINAEVNHIGLEPIKQDSHYT